MRKTFELSLILVVLLTTAREAAAQTSSLYGAPEQRRGMTLANTSWTYQPTPEPKEIQMHDLLTVVVDIKSQVISEGEMDRRKKADGTLSLQDWIKLEGLSVIPAPQYHGDPTMSGYMNNKFRAEAELETREAMKLRIAAEVVDIRPNGLLVIDGQRTVQNNEESWELSLSGIVRPEDVLPNNTVLSENVDKLRINKREKGHVMDGYRRGWLLKWLDTYQPF